MGSLQSALDEYEKSRSRTLAIEQFAAQLKTPASGTVPYIEVLFGKNNDLEISADDTCLVLFESQHRHLTETHNSIGSLSLSYSQRCETRRWLIHLESATVEIDWVQGIGQVRDEEVGEEIQVSEANTRNELFIHEMDYFISHVLTGVDITNIQQAEKINEFIDQVNSYR